MPIMEAQEVLAKLEGFPIRVFEPGDVVLSEGGASGRLLFLKSGAVDVVMSEIDLNRVDQPGAVFGEVGLLLDTGHTANVVAVRSSSFYVVEDGAAYLRAEPLAALYVATVLAGRLDAVNHLVVDAKQRATESGQRRGLVGEMIERLARALQMRVPPS
jgi:CRP/FNR family transcriptional regulator, cyclic AMP receptor protein